jgi:putative MATE family efflux protein
MTWLIGMNNGAGIVMAQYWGAKRYDDFREVVASMFRVTLGITIFISVFGVLFAPVMLRMMNVPDHILPNSLAYIRIILGFIIFIAIFNACAVILRSVGDSKTPFRAMVISSLVNIALDLILVIGFGLGVAWVAAATIVAQFCAALYCVIVIIRKRKSMYLEGVFKVNGTEKIKQICRIGIPTAMQSCAVAIGGMSVQGIVNGYGGSVMAAYTTALRIDMLTIQIIVAFGMALSVFTGQNMGNQDFERIKEGLKATLKIMTVACVILAVGVLLFRYPLLGLFLNKDTDADAISYGAQYLSIIGIAYIIAGVMNSYLNVIRGAGDVKISVATGLTELAGRIFFAFILTGPVGLGVFGIWLSTPLSWGCGCVVPMVRYYQGNWKKKGVVRKEADI